jgi:hypothetical protein
MFGMLSTVATQKKQKLQKQSYKSKVAKAKLQKQSCKSKVAKTKLQK